MNRKTVYSILLGVSALLSVLAIITILPNAGASKPNIFGYKSICSFSPVGTIILCWMAGIVCTIRARVKTEEKKKVIPAPIIMLSIIFMVGIGFYSIQYASITGGFSKVIRETKVSAPLIVQETGDFTADYATGEIMVKVSVIMENGKIMDIKLISSKNIEKNVSESVIREILEKQNPQVDGVSGATASSLALMKAVEMAVDGSK